MSFDIMSFLMGKVAGGGGSGSKTFLMSGWVKSYGNQADIDGNDVDLKAGGYGHNVRIAPPAYVAKDGNFPKDSVLKVAITVNTVSPRLKFSLNSSGTITSKTGLFQQQLTNYFYTTETGSDVLTGTFSNASSQYVEFAPTLLNGNQDGSENAKITITGMSFNDEIIFGTV